MAAARSAAAAPYPAPASHPPAGQPKRNFLPRVAGLSRRGQTPLARPVPNKKALPHPQESPGAAVLGSANPSTSSNGETGELVAQIGQAHGQRRGEVHHSSFVHLSATDANAEVPRRSDDSYPHRSTNSRATHITDLTYDVLINQSSHGLSQRKACVNGLLVCVCVRVRRACITVIRPQKRNTLSHALSFSLYIHTCTDIHTYMV
ncbi:uncharacterized protein LOC111081517 isoform X2 [Drosophila obscura]|uniref:uncharacterized protein LOC111081517 isoform X2 n=1 Tax=Drosophila obscura TaxID=7282 RepID=UPI001BB224B9|nr:uncharacterized protein LOC111081517 isoform X2 [Drosophila obscura]